MKTKSHKFTVHYPDDETMVIKLDGKNIFSGNHDDDGWAGMEAVESVVTEIAKILKIPLLDNQ